MSVLKIKIGQIVYEIDVPGNYLQSRFGTFKNENGPFKMSRSNWDNSQFFNFQSKECFSILVDVERGNYTTEKKISDRDKKAILEKVEKENVFFSAHECEELAKRIVSSMPHDTEKHRFVLRKYLKVTAFFLDGEWKFRTEYKINEVYSSMKQEKTLRVIDYYGYTEKEKLGIFECPDKNIFEALL